MFRQREVREKDGDPEQRTKLVEKIATKPSSARGTRTSERSNTQSQQSRNPQGERSTQSRQGSMVFGSANAASANAAYVCNEPRVFLFLLDMDSSTTCHSSQQVCRVSSFSPWQLFNSAQNSSQFYQPQGQQTMQRTAQVSQTMGPGFGGEAPQIQYLHHPPGTSPMVLQVSPQSQIFRNVDTRQMPSVRAGHDEYWCSSRKYSTIA
jgi:hypothetical protein